MLPQKASAISTRFIAELGPTVKKKPLPVVVATLVSIFLVVMVIMMLLATKTPRSEMFDTFDTRQCRIDDCGRGGPMSEWENRIIGGREAAVGQFPYQVVLTDRSHPKNQVLCGGSMINDRWILTAAHCLRADDGTLVNKHDIRVSVNIIDVAEAELNDLWVQEYFVHPKHNPVRKMYDIALIKTEQSISKASKHSTHPICLPFNDFDFEDARVAHASGFGRVRERDSQPSETLRAAKVDLLPASSCSIKYIPDYDDESMICAGDMTGEHGVCYGDSGGPLAIKNAKGSLVLRGITSFGDGCGRRNTPAVFTKVSHYLKWICESINDNTPTNSILS